jgi:hypothetical protein
MSIVVPLSTVAKFGSFLLWMVASFILLGRIFATWRQEKRAGESNKGIFEIFKKIAISKKKKKKLRSRQI